VDAASWEFGVRRLDGAFLTLSIFVVSESKAPVKPAHSKYFFSSLLEFEIQNIVHVYEPMKVPES
jgi:hypothetical protein